MKSDKIDTLVNSLIASKGWTRGYAEAFVLDLLEDTPVAPIVEDAATVISQLDALEQTVRDFHGRDGTYCFHFSTFNLYQWGTHLPKDVYAKMDIEDWAVEIVWIDNSFSTATYWVTLKEILDWKYGLQT